MLWRKKNEHQVERKQFIFTPNLIAPRMGKQSRRLTGFRIGVFDIATGTFSPHSVRAKNLAGFPALIDAVRRA